MLSPWPTIGKVVSLALGVFLLACGGSALNQYQEKDIDALMERTRRRPIPAGHIRPLLGLFAILWYNVLYTYLKRRSAFAIIPGALVGVIPPAMGWVVGGGGLSHPKLWAIGFLFFMWQVPHFWLIMLDFGKEYEEAGLPLPSLRSMFGERSLRRIIFHWINALAVGSLCVSLYGLANAPLIQLALFAAAL